MWILVIGLIIGLGYGIMEVWDLVKDFIINGWNWDIIRENFRGISLASIELAVIGQSYIIAKQANIDKQKKRRDERLFFMFVKRNGKKYLVGVMSCGKGFTGNNFQFSRNSTEGLPKRCNAVFSRLCGFEHLFGGIFDLISLHNLLKNGKKWKNFFFTLSNL